MNIEHIPDMGFAETDAQADAETFAQTDAPVYNPRKKQTNLEYFHGFLEKRGSAVNTIDSYLTSVRHFHSLYHEITVENLQAYKAWLMERYKPSTVNTRIYGINQYVAALQAREDTDCLRGDVFLTPYKLPSVRHQQKPFLNNVISKRDYERFKRCLKRDHNMFWYFVVRFLGATGARVSELIQIKAEHIQIGCMDLYSKGGESTPDLFSGKTVRGNAGLAGFQTDTIRFHLYQPSGPSHYAPGDRKPAQSAGPAVPHPGGNRLSPFFPAPVCQELSAEIQ